MDMKLNSVVVAIGLVLLAASCHPAPVSQDSALLTQLLKKANTVLDRIIAQENGGSKKKEVDDVQLQQRNQDAGDRSEKGKSGTEGSDNKAALEKLAKSEDGPVPFKKSEIQKKVEKNEEGPVPFKKRGNKQDGADNDISLEKVLRYLQYLRKHEQTKRDRD